MMELVLMTESGSWNPLIWLGAFVIILAIVYIIRSRGTKRYKHGTEQTLPFFSGNIAPPKNIKSSNLYWGFFATFEKCYKFLKRIHTGIVNDYVYSFVLLLVVMLVALMFGGFL